MNKAQYYIVPRTSLDIFDDTSGDLQYVNESYFQAPASSGYGSPAADPITDCGAPEDEEIDLHNKESDHATIILSEEGVVMTFLQEFCVDVSTYQPVIWVERDGQVVLFF